MRAAGYKKEIAVGEYGINHKFLFVGDMIVDPWAEVVCNRDQWRGNINAYGGSIKEGVMRGRLLGHDHFELEDEEPTVAEVISKDYITELARNKNLQKSFQFLTAKIKINTKSDTEPPPQNKPK